MDIRKGVFSMNELWKQAQKLAEENYEKEFGACTWDDADKYEREDFVFDAYEKLGGVEFDKKIAKLSELQSELKNHMKYNEDYMTNHNKYKDKYDELSHKIFELKKEIKDMMQRDSKGRFVSTKKVTNNETTNTNSNMKGNDTMMNNKMTNKEVRMETLKANGVNTDNFFDLSMRIPFGAEVKIVVDGKEMVIPATSTETTATAYGNHVVGNGLIGNYVGVPTILSSNGDICNAETGEVLVMANDSIAQSIINDGYVKNSSLFRRWVTAQTFRLLEYVDRRNSNRKGWEAGFKDMYGYGYQFEMLADELHTLAKLQREDPEYFAERTRFFNGDVVVATLEDYLYRLKKYCKKQMRENPRAYRGQAYVKLARYGNVLVKDLDDKVFNPIANDGIFSVMKANADGNYAKIEKAFNEFMSKYYNKLPYETPKCATFKDAYKGIGAFESLKNMIRFHNVVLDGCNNKYDSERELYSILGNTPNSDVWVFHNLLVSTIELNKFNLRQSIANGHAAPNTVSEKADRY
jgi:hypothetical protein